MKNGEKSIKKQRIPFVYIVTFYDFFLKFWIKKMWPFKYIFYRSSRQQNELHFLFLQCHKLIFRKRGFFSLEKSRYHLVSNFVFQIKETMTIILKKFFFRLFLWWHVIYQVVLPFIVVIPEKCGLPRPLPPPGKRYLPPPCEIIRRESKCMKLKRI